MITLEKYNIRLKQLAEDDIELVRAWRNSPAIAQYMSFREHITEEMQRRWFENVTAKGDLYFLIHYAGKPVGVINAKDLDYEKRECEDGIFIGDESAQNSIVSYCSVFCLSDFLFDTLGFLRIRAHILDTNQRAIRYNLSIGFKPTDEVVDGCNRLYYQERADYKAASARIRRLLHF